MAHYYYLNAYRASRNRSAMEIRYMLFGLCYSHWVKVLPARASCGGSDPQIRDKYHSGPGSGTSGACKRKPTGSSKIL